MRNIRLRDEIYTLTTTQVRAVVLLCLGGGFLAGIIALKLYQIYEYSKEVCLH